MVTGVSNHKDLSSDNTFQVCSLGSGSKGNGTLVSFGETLLLIDCGFSVKECVRRLALKDIKPQQISAILVTHEHADHIGGVAGLSKKFSIPVWINKGTSLHKKAAAIERMQIFNSHQSFFIGEFEITPVAVPHDSREATQFIISTANYSVGLLTDVGHITAHIIEAYSSCQTLLLEFNYEHELLINGKYPFALKQRVSGDLGHLSNLQALEMLSHLDLSKLSLLVAMHISEENNSKEIVLEKLEEKLQGASLKYLLADQSKGFDWQIC